MSSVPARCLNFHISKRTFRSKADANRTRIWVQSRGDKMATARKRGKAAKLYVFECKHCGLWHLSSQAPKS